MHGDVVVIDILPESEWRISTERLRDFAMLSSPNNDDDNIEEVEKVAQAMEGININEEENKQQEIVPMEDEVPVRNSQKSNNNHCHQISGSIEELKRQHPNCWSQFIQKTARVVEIKERKHSRCSAGYLKLFQDKNPNFALFSPIDSRFPRLKIAKSNCPEHFFNRPQDFKEFLYIGKLVQWDLVPFGVGLLTHNLGSDKDVSVRTKGILLENGIDHENEFPNGIENSLPSLPFTIPNEEIKNRKDYRKNCVFTIDPLTARDLDDALSIEKMEDGNFKVGVHIADVSYFVS